MSDFCGNYLDDIIISRKKNMMCILTCLIRFHKWKKHNFKKTMKNINPKVSNMKVPFAAVKDKNVKFLNT